MVIEGWVNNIIDNLDLSVGQGWEVLIECLLEVLLDWGVDIDKMSHLLVDYWG